jgi:hypothetical protein
MVYQSGKESYHLRFIIHASWAQTPFLHHKGHLGVPVSWTHDELWGSQRLKLDPRNLKRRWVPTKYINKCDFWGAYTCDLLLIILKKGNDASHTVTPLHLSTVIPRNIFASMLLKPWWIYYTLMYDLAFTYMLVFLEWSIGYDWKGCSNCWWIFPPCFFLLVILFLVSINILEVTVLVVAWLQV